MASFDALLAAGVNVSGVILIQENGGVLTTVQEKKIKKKEEKERKEEKGETPIP